MATPGLFINCLLQDTKGNIWIATDGQGLYRLDPNTGKYKQYRHEDGNSFSLGDNNVYCIIEDHNHAFWIGTAASGALTADALQADKEKCLTAGMNGFVAKPFRLYELRQVLDRFLN